MHTCRSSSAPMSGTVVIWHAQKPEKIPTCLLELRTQHVTAVWLLFLCALHYITLDTRWTHAAQICSMIAWHSTANIAPAYIAGLTTGAAAATGAAWLRHEPLKSCMLCIGHVLSKGGVKGKGAWLTGQPICSPPCIMPSTGTVLCGLCKPPVDGRIPRPCPALLHSTAATLERKQSAETP